MDTKQSVTDNIVDFPALAIVAQLSAAAHVFFSLPLIFYIIGQQTDFFLMEYANPALFDPSRFRGSLYPLWNFATRGGILSMVILIGILVPHFALIMGLIGAFTGSLLCFVLPPLFHLRLFWNDLTTTQCVVRISIVVFGIVAGSMGIICSALELRAVFGSE